MKNSLKISLFITFVAMISACKPDLIPEEIKEAYGAYAYKKGDSISLVLQIFDSVFSYNIFVNGYYLNLYPNMMGGEFEYYWLDISDNADKFGVNINFEAQNHYSKTIYENQTKVNFGHLTILNYDDILNIDGVSYDSVYYMKDEVAGYEMYSSKNYGFIKIWNDTISYKFVR